MGDLTTNISRHEVACKCGCGFDTADYETTAAVQEACDYFSQLLEGKCILIINSGCRCESWNKHVGGSKNSQHLYSRAIDHYIRGISIKELADYYLKKYPDKYGIGIYKNFIHLDTKSGPPRRW
jgi:uncharacterized protein YcbK (DUF882 family)